MNIANFCGRKSKNHWLAKVSGLLIRLPAKVYLLGLVALMK